MHTDADPGMNSTTMTSKERAQIERRIERIQAQLKITAPQEVSAANKPLEVEADKLEELYQERDQLLKRLDEDAD